MNVTELIRELKEIPGHLQVFFNDSMIEKIVNKLTIKESISPRGIKFLMLTEETNSPKPQAQVTNQAGKISSKNPEPMADNTKPKKKGGAHAKMTEEKTQEILKLIQKGLKYTIIAEIINCSVSHVSRTAKKHGLKEKKVGRPKRSVKAKLQKDFTGYNVKCKRCDKGKPSTEYKGTWKICKTCRKRS